MTDSNVTPLEIPKANRMVSIDAYRALAILMMIFCTTLTEGNFGVSGVPAWLPHSDPPVGITFMDVGCPFFLFVVGLCIPFSITFRLKKVDSKIRLYLHILARAAKLMVMGIFMRNFWQYRNTASPIGMSISAWGVLLFISFFLIWNQYPKAEGLKRKLFMALRIGGIILLIYLAAIYRIPWGQGQRGLIFATGTFWMWWVLGIIAWAYLVSCAVYLMFKNNIEAVMGCLGLHLLMYTGDALGAFKDFHFLDGIMRYVPFGPLLGSWPAMSTAGLIVGMLFFEGSPAQTPKRRIKWILLFGAGLFIAGFLLKPLFGVSSGEGRATPTWALYCSTMSCVIFAFFYWILDVKGNQKWIEFIMPVAKNPLQIYLLSRLIHPLFTLLGINFINNYFNSGLAGFARTTVYCTLICLFSTWLTKRCHVKLHL